MDNSLDPAQRKFILVVYVAVLAAAIVLAGMTSIFSYYTHLAIAAPKCVEATLVDGHRTAITDVFAFPVFSLIIVAMIVRIGLGKSASDYLKTLDAPVARLFSLQITLGMSLILTVLVTALLMVGIAHVFVAARYDAVAKYCLEPAVVRPTK